MRWRRHSPPDPGAGHYFQANADTFKASLKPWTEAIAAFKANTGIRRSRSPNRRRLYAAGDRLQDHDAVQPQEAIMNGTDPSPQDVTHRTACSPATR